MPTRLPLKAPEHDSDPDRPRNLSQAREIIARLKRQLPGTSGALRLSAPPVPGMAGTKPPAGGKPIKPLDPSTHPSPHPGESPPKSPGYPPPSPGNLSPASMKEFLSQRTDRELQQLLAVETGRIRKEQRPELIAKLYREIRERRK
jgi:hypothetical protein